ncbi:hypothetical protein [Actinokineospora sp.]|uniref:hypothetical protein n=1 Tax=Actinokineospora sp. TaxID=1872133 RepID=UPI004037BF30
MTESVMAQAEQDRVTKEVGRALVRAAGPGWQRIRAEYRSVGRHVEVDVAVTGPDGDQHPVRPPVEVVEGLGRMRGGMYRPGRGTWLSAVYVIEPPGTFTVEFEPDVEPPWRRVPPPIGFADELRFFPRSEDNIPDWFRVRAGLPPAVSSETQAAHTPPGGIELPAGGPQARPGVPFHPNTPPGGNPRGPGAFPHGPAVGNPLPHRHPAERNPR